METQVTAVMPQETEAQRLSLYDCYMQAAADAACEGDDAASGYYQARAQAALNGRA